MSYTKVSGAVAAMVTALALSGIAYGDTGKSPNGAPGPAGNPNQPAAEPQANAPAGPVGNEQQKNENKGQTQKAQRNAASKGKSGASHGKSGAAKTQRGRSGSAPSRGNGSNANPTPGTPRKGGGNGKGGSKSGRGAPKGKITICHATKSETNPYVEITISVNGLNGHGPAADPRHHEGSWQDIIPAPAGGCPSAGQQQTSTGTAEQPATTAPASGEISRFVAPLPKVALAAPAAGQAVLGVQESGASAPAESGANGVLGASAAGSTPVAGAPASALATRAANATSDRLPFTGFGLGIVLLIAAALLVGGLLMRRVSAPRA